uniref:Uncharacterized protein n=1 Tax=Apis cerana TaxID=7461 RepID=V9I879_APICE
MEEEEEEEEDDCDSQVLEDLRRQSRADSLDYLHRQQGIGNSEERSKAELVGEKKSSRNSEAQAKCKYQDVEHFDEQVLEELRSRGTVVSPQPSGIPCSPASRRPSSAYLERLLPSPPCSVSCSEDAKNDLTLKGILSSPNQIEMRDHEKQKEISNRCDQVPSDHLPTRLDHPAGRKPAKSCFQEARSCARPMSSGDIHSSTYLDRGPKRPVSAEWSACGRQKGQSACQRGAKARGHQVMEEGCATSTSTDKLLDPASQLRELIETSGHLIPDPLLVPRDYLPGLAAAPATEIPKLLASRPELRLPEALTRPDLLRDPDLLVISLTHLQHVLDHGEGPVSRSRQSSHPRINNGAGKGGAGGHASNGRKNAFQTRPKLSCKPIGTLMPAPIDLSSSRRTNTYLPLLRVRSGLLKQEPEVSSTASSPDESQLWHPLFGSQKRQHHQQHQQQQNQHSQQQQQQQQQPTTTTTQTPTKSSSATAKSASTSTTAPTSAPTPTPTRLLAQDHLGVLTTVTLTLAAGRVVLIKERREHSSRRWPKRDRSSRLLLSRFVIREKKKKKKKKKEEEEEKKKGRRNQSKPPSNTKRMLHTTGVPTNFEHSLRPIHRDTLRRKTFSLIIVAAQISRVPR